MEQALREAKDSLFHAGQEQVSLADGLAEMANRSLSTITATSRVSKYRVYIHLSTTGGWVNGRGAIPPSLAAKFACDGVIQPLWETDGRPVSMGRDQRMSPPGHAGSSRTATEAVGTRDAPPPSTSRSTTSTTGPRAATPTTTGCSASVRSTTMHTTAPSSP